MLKKTMAVALAGLMSVSAFPLQVSAEENGDKVDITIMCAYASEDPHGQYAVSYTHLTLPTNREV